MLTPLDAARDLLRRGIPPIPVPSGQKAPVLAGWEDLRLRADELPAYFDGAAQNVGGLNGAPAANLIDVDLDDLIAVQLAPEFLVGTQAIFGRVGKRRSHWLYRTDDLPRTERFRAPDGRTLLELRSTGTQTLYPGSRHPSGELIEWECDGEPTQIDGRFLRRCAAQLAAATLLAIVWPVPGSRHDFVLATSGYLLGNGMPPTDVRRIIDAAARAAGDEEADRRIRDVEDTARALTEERKVTGGPTFMELVPDGSKVLDRLAAWLALPSARRSGPLHWPGIGPAGVDDEQPSPLPPVPPFPTEVLPGAARSLVEEGAAALACPPDFIAVPLLVIAGAVMGNSFLIEFKADYTMYPMLWAIVIGDPGSTKSPALRVAQRPVNVLQKEAYDAYVEAQAQWKRDLAEWEKCPPSQRGPRPVEPQLTHYWTSDATLEAIAGLIEPAHTEDGVGDEPTGVAFIADEATGWVAANNQYKGGKGSDRQRWLTSWSGAPLKVDRKTGKKVLYVNDPVIGVTGGAQPDMLTTLADEAQRRDGFVERILYSWPDAEAGKWTEAGIAEETKEAMLAVVRMLRREHRAAAPVRLDPAARRLWVAWYNENKRLTRQARGLVSGIYSKLDQQCARLCLVLHALAHPDTPHMEPVSAETMSGAIALTEYFRQHAHRAMTRFGVSTSGLAGGLAAQVLRVLLRAADWLSVTAIHNDLGRNCRAADLHAALGELEQADLAERRPLPTGERGGRPGEEWRVTKKRTNAGTEDAGGFFVSSFLREPSPPRVCPLCGAELGEGDACWDCDTQPCAVCGGSTGDATWERCAGCKNGRASAEEIDDP